MLRLWLLGLFIAAHVHAPRTAYEKDMAASVLLHMKWQTDKGFAYGGCSGTYILPDVILTAAHCVESPQTNLWAKGINDHFGYPVHLIAWDKRLDLALLQSPYKHYYIHIGKVPKRKSYVLNIGNPEGFDFVPSEGIVSIPDYSYGKQHFLITTAMANPGSSGGGAFDKNGRLIGVNTMIIGIFGWTGITMAVNTESINQFLNWVTLMKVI